MLPSRLASAITLVLCTLASQPAAAQPTTWVTASTLPGLTALGEAAHAEVLATLAGTQARYMLDGGPGGWQVHDGDLTLGTSLDLDTNLIVRGNVQLAGSLDDGHGAGHLIVFGSLALDHAFSWGTLHVTGDLVATGVVFAVYNDFTFAVQGKVDAVGLVLSDKFSDYRAGTLAFTLNDSSTPDAAAEASAGTALRLLESALFTTPGSLELDEDDELVSLTPDFDVSRARVRAGLSLLRAQPAAPALVSQAAAAIAADTPIATLRTLIRGDVLLAQLIAARPVVPTALHADLLAIDDPVVQGWMAQVAPQASFARRRASLTPDLAATLATHPETSEATLSEIAAHADAAVRLTLAGRDPLPLALRERLATDTDPSVRAAFINDQLSAATRATLAADADPAVRRAIAAVSLDAHQTRALLTPADLDTHMALGRSLRAQAEHLAVRRMSDAERAALADALLHGGAGDSAFARRQLATSAFLALPPAEQAARFAGLLSRLDADVVAEHTPSAEVMARLVALAREQSEPIPKKLGRNPALPDALQQAIIEAAEAFDPPRVPVDDFAPTPDEALEELLYNDAAPAILSDARVMQITRLVLRRGIAPADGGVQNAYFHYHGFSAEAIDAIGARRGANEDWALTVLMQPAATRAQLVPALRRWYDDPAVGAELSRLDGLDDAAFWPALARATSADLREAAARNRSTPADVLARLLDDPEQDVRQQACWNPRLPEADAVRLAKAFTPCVLGNTAVPLAVLDAVALTAPTAAVRGEAWKAISLRRRTAR